MDITTEFQPGQIVSLEHGDRSLFAEVIQVVVSRQLCWVRPLLLVNNTDQTAVVTDLRSESDLLWSIDLFRPALDTEVICWLSQVLVKEQKPLPDSVAKHLLNEFIYLIWQEQKNYML